MTTIFNRSHARDRFIPLRSTEKNSISNFSPCQKKQSMQITSTSSYSSYIANQLSLSSKILSWNAESKTKSKDSIKKCSSQDLQWIDKTNQQQKINSFKKIRKSPQKVLDAPGLRDDFYTNILDYSKHGSIGVALDNQVYLYSTQQLIQLCRSSFGSYVSSLKFHDHLMTVGTSRGLVELYDLQKNSLVRTISSHIDRVSSLEYLNDTLLTGSKDKFIISHDLRSKNSVQNTFRAHHGQVCSLKAKSPYENIFASGSNDNSVIIWDARYNNQIVSKLKGHKAAVKALNWCPWKNGYLATGGGTGDKTIKIWNTNSQNLILSKDTTSQVSSLLWNSNLKCLISSHGFKKNEINFWNIENFTLKRQTSLLGHSGRILGMVQSNEQDTIWTASADQTIRYWRLFSQQKSENKENIQSNRIL